LEAFDVTPLPVSAPWNAKPVVPVGDRAAVQPLLEVEIQDTAGNTARDGVFFEPRNRV
jgi:hypothetical protein